MKLVFWGTPAYAVPSLNALVDAGHQVLAVVSQPDRRRGRGRSLQPSPVKQRALDLGLPVFTPERIRHDIETQQALDALGADLYVVVAFGQILPAEVLAQPPLGCWNGHGSLLPRWRGAAPIQWSLIEGDPETGVGIMAMEIGLDTGPVLLEDRVPIALLENAHGLSARLSALTAALLVEALPRIAAAGAGTEAERWLRLGVRHQSPEGLTYARLITKEDLLLDWGLSCLALHRRVMGLHPNAFTHWRGRRLKVLATEPLVRRLRDDLSPEVAPLADRWGLTGDGCSDASPAPPGQVLALAPGLGVLVATSGCPLLIRAGQLEGKAPATGQALLQQLDAAPGEAFSSLAGDQPA
ncbi:MAG: methionyl-tRNA formyltransferase [Cyanobacteriota bacterium]